MNKISCSLFGALFILLWIVGLVVAKGFWSTLIGIFIFPWAWYLAVEHIMILLGVI